MEEEVGEGKGSRLLTCLMSQQSASCRVWDG